MSNSGVTNLFANTSMVDPNYQTPSHLDTLSDIFLGTNNKDIINLHNQNEFNKQQLANQLGSSIFANKYINEHKYLWNKNGMLAAGIIPLAMTGAGGVQSALSSNSGSGSNYSTHNYNRKNKTNFLGAAIKLGSIVLSLL